MLRLSRPDLSNFPEITINVLSSDGRGAPLAESDLTRLALRENGVPIANPNVQFVPVGVDIIFVLDADQSLNIIDEGRSVTRLATVQEMLERYATRFMNPSGFDRISLLVPNASGEAGQFLVQDSGSPEALVVAAQSYAPELPQDAPINAMMQQAIAHAAEIKENGRYQAILLLSEARRLPQFLDFQTLVAEAQAIELPLFTAILGAQASLDEVDAAAALYQPTRAFYVHVPRPEEADSLFLIWQRQGNQAKIRYRSLLRQSGDYNITVNVGNLTASTQLNLEIVPPQLALALPSTAVQRQGSTPDSPLIELEPTTLSIPVQLTWPDNLPRAITAVSLFVDGQLQPQINTPQPDESGLLTLSWNVQSVNTGAYRLHAELTDVLGYTSETETVVMTITAVRPDPPTPTPVPTATPSPVERVTEVTSAVSRDDWLLILAGLGLLGLVLILLRWWLRRPRQLAPRPRRARPTTADEAQDEVDETLVASLHLVEDAPGNRTNIVIEQDNMAIGRDLEVAQIVFGDSSVSRLHARIRRRNGRYYLYDEGSASGTFLNHERLGLSPRQLQNGDEIRLGRLHLRFQLRPPTAEANAAPNDEPEIADDSETQNADRPDFPDLEP
ncbi:MAG: FHA domain-containing protein [Ardenticatenaceae bacterium]|nr:FHA domain-containing protein [Anaerolineales bacterium]MCB8938328.1 FHA domain-containing protein [Ardenticatenaceae bacterium]MCB8975365.1 FHA domain-containing protein [Ardenticatenaceae bacterium]